MKHHYAYSLGYRAHEDSLALRLGTLIHRALEIWWRDRDAEKALHVFLESWESKEHEKFRAQAMVMGYIARWPFDDIEVLHVEKSFVYEIQPGDKFAGKFDAIARINGEDWIVDHKTTSDTSENYFRRLDLDSQISHYWAAAQEMGLAPAGFLYDVLYKPNLRLRKGETPEEFGDRCFEEIRSNPGKYYRREHVVRLEHEMQSIRHEALETIRQMKERKPVRNPNRCKDYNTMCTYFDVCSGAGRLVDLRRIERKHEEL